jgi:hypothetical protein
MRTVPKPWALREPQFAAENEKGLVMGEKSMKDSFDLVMASQAPVSKTQSPVLVKSFLTMNVWPR